MYTQVGRQVNSQGGRVIKGYVHKLFKKLWVKPFNWFIPHGHYFECENEMHRPYLYSFQNKNGRQTDTPPTP